MLCTDMTLLHTTPATETAEPLRCKRWSCDHCRKERRRDLIKLATHGEPDRMITLTSNPNWGGSPEERALALVDAWRRCRRAAMRRFKLKRLAFLAVFEKTKRGEPHLHILVRSQYIPQRWLSDFMADAMDAPVVDIRRITSPKVAAAYVAKYVGKQPHQFEGCKRYWRSQDYQLEKHKKEKRSRAPGEFFDIIFTSYWSFLYQQAQFGRLGRVDGYKAELLPYGARYRC